MRIRSLAIFALLALVGATIVSHSLASPGTWLIYDRGELDVVVAPFYDPFLQQWHHTQYAVKFGPLPIVLDVTSLYRISAINVTISGGAHLREFDMAITNETNTGTGVAHVVMYSLPHQSDVPGDVWYSVDFGSVGPLYIEALQEFLVDFYPVLESATQPDWEPTGLWLDEDETPSGRSYVLITNAGQIPFPSSWEPMESGDLLIRVDVEPVTPQSLLVNLKGTMQNADPEFFRGYEITCTDQLKNALAKKIDQVIGMFDNGDFQGGYKKLDMDISPKLNICETARVRALSWLSLDEELSGAVYRFAARCQGLIGTIKLADPRPTP